MAKEPWGTEVSNGDHAAVGSIPHFPEGLGRALDRDSTHMAGRPTD